MRQNINGYKLYLENTNTQSETTVIFIHAFPMDRNMWTPQVKVLKNKYRVITYDVRGFGYSEVGDGQYTIEDYADDLAKVIEKIEVTKVVACGLSMGGYILLRAITKYPDLFKGIVLCDTRSEADSNEAKIKRAETIKLIKTKGVKAFVNGFMESVLSIATFDNNPELVIKVTKIIESNSPLAICGALLAMAGRLELSDSLDEIKVPALIMVGEEDKLTPPIASQSMHEKISGSELRIISNAAHFTNLENPNEFNENLLNFLAQFDK